jgi:hypothetical protein
MGVTRSSAALLSRRQFLLGLPLAPALLAGCGTPLPLSVAPRPGTDGEALLMASARQHGWDAFAAVDDINIAYDGAWRPFINGIQPEVVDAGYRGSSQERLMPRRGVNAQHYRGPRGTKQVFWQRGQGSAAQPGEVAVWYDGRESTSAPLRSAAALVAEAYGMFLLGPLWLAGRGFPAERAVTERVHGRLCDVVHVWIRPGLGQVAADRVSVCIDRDDAITRRLRFTLEGFAGTRGAVAEVDTFEHRRLWGVLWPMRSYEEVVHPLRLPAHDWHVTGLDLNRGYTPDALRGPAFSGAAAAPAAALPA